MLQKQIDAVDHDQVQGIINIEEIFHLHPSARSVIERKRDQREERDPLVIDADERKGGERNAKADELCKLSRCRENDHGHQYAPNAVIHAVIRVREKMGKTLHQKNGGGENAGEEQPCVEAIFFQRVVKRIDQNDGKGKRDEDTLIKRIHRKEIYELANHAESEHLQKVFGSVFRIFRALRDHVSENWERQSADKTEDHILREKLETDVVTGHGDQCKDL